MKAVRIDNFSPFKILNNQTQVGLAVKSNDLYVPVNLGLDESRAHSANCHYSYIV